MPKFGLQISIKARQKQLSTLKHWELWLAYCNASLLFHFRMTNQSYSTTTVLTICKMSVNWLQSNIRSQIYTLNVIVINLKQLLIYGRTDNTKAGPSSPISIDFKIVLKMLNGLMWTLIAPLHNFQSINFQSISTSSCLITSEQERYIQEKQ